MRLVLATVGVIISSMLYAQDISIQLEEMAAMPEPVANNAVCEGGSDAVYSFTGIDTLKNHNGIHLKSFKYSVSVNTWETLPDVPDTLGKIAAGASYIDGIIYVIGGYHVLPNGNELSSNKVHRFDVGSDTWLTDGENIPVAIDDHVQVVYKDSLIYVVTGWSNSGNVADVQIYNPTTDIWQAGTSTPTTANYRLFGASGTIIGDTIYYYGGAKNGFNFNAGNTLLKGAINPQDPTQITWSEETIDTGIKAYRSACTDYHGRAFWIGGSSITYNYNGIAYNGSGGVPPNNQVFIVNASYSTWDTLSLDLPMDLRGIAKTNHTTRYLAGGMLDNQQVSAKTYKLTFQDLTEIKQLEGVEELAVFPNPTNGSFTLKGLEANHPVSVVNQLGQNVPFTRNGNQISVLNARKGVYLVISGQNRLKISIR